MRVLGCLYSPGFRSLCCNVVHFFCDLEKLNLVNPTTRPGPHAFYRNVTGKECVGLLPTTVAPGLFAVRPIHGPVLFSSNVKGCYVTSQEHLLMCFRARFAVAQLMSSASTIHIHISALQFHAHHVAQICK
jgi:hypothetical protein